MQLEENTMGVSGEQVFNGWQMVNFCPILHLQHIY